MSILIALSITISTIIVLTITGDFGGDLAASGSPKDEETFKKWLKKLADAPKRLARKVAEALSAIMGSVVGAILSFPGKAVGFVAKHNWVLIIFDAELILVWSSQKVISRYDMGLQSCS